MLFVATLYVLYRGRYERNSMHYMMLGSAITMWIVATAVRNTSMIHSLSHTIVLTGVASRYRLWTCHQGFHNP